MFRFIVPIIALAGLSACGTNPANYNSTVNAAVAKAAMVACQLDGQIQPVAVTVASTGAAVAAVAGGAVPGAVAAVPLVNGAVAVDQDVIHPDVVKVCAALGMTAATASTTAPAS